MATLTDTTRPTGEAGSRPPRQRKSTARLGPVPVRAPGEPPLWWEAGACREADPQIFFPADHGRARERIAQEKAALKLCAQCPVRRICLEHALAVPERFGVWGGTTELDRRGSRRRRNPSTQSPASTSMPALVPKPVAAAAVLGDGNSDANCDGVSTAQAA